MQDGQSVGGLQGETYARAPALPTMPPSDHSSLEAKIADVFTIWRSTTATHDSGLRRASRLR